MTVHIKIAGTWELVQHLWAKRSGAWVPVRRGFVKNDGAWKQFFQDEVVATITANASQIDATDYFSAEDWANPLLNKRLVIPADIYAWSYTPGTPALTTGTDRGGKLIIENAGLVLGAGGAANGGDGGDAILVEQDGVTIINTGDIKGGGGGGGAGGQGGPGTYQTTIREPSSGDIFGRSWVEGFDARWAQYTPAGNADIAILWNSPPVNIVIQNSAGLTSYYYDGYTYHRGTLRFTSDWYYSGIYRTRVDNTYTAGGAAGAGARGTGYDANLTLLSTTGAVGANGGTNAGKGGKGGDGGGWGEAGTTGNTGAGGNNGGGAGGAAGGAAGYYINGSDNLDLFTNTGTVLGRIA